MLLILIVSCLLAPGSGIARAEPRQPMNPAIPLDSQADGSWSSGWRDLPVGVTTFTFALAGDPAMFAVDMWFRDTAASGSGINQRYYGGDDVAGQQVGAYWRALTATSIEVVRGANDTVADQVLLRIWQPDPPAWDSDWRNIARNQLLTLTHNVGGNTDDYTVGIKFRNPNSAVWGIHQAGFGGTESANLLQGAVWLNLTNSSLQVRRFLDDAQVVQVRVQIFLPADPPAFDSGWQSVAQGASMPLAHNLGGDVTDYVVRYSARSTAEKVNIIGMGGKDVAGNVIGSYWQELTATTVRVYRSANDQFAQNVRVRIFLPTRYAYLPLTLNQ
jgi:hypothetical protein